MTTLTVRQAVFSILIFATLAIGPAVHAQVSAPQGNSPSFKMSGQAQLHSNFVDHGLTQTEKDPALQGQFAFNFGPQFVMGLWGSNAHYENSSEHLWLRLYGTIKINFSPNVRTDLQYTKHQFYGAGGRDGNTIGLHFDIYKYLFLIDMDSNWEGSGTAANHISFGTTTDVFGNWKWETLGGYNMLKASGYSNYFDVATFLGRKFNEIYTQGGLTLTTNSSQFGGRGNYFIVIKAGVSF